MLKHVSLPVFFVVVSMPKVPSKIVKNSKAVDRQTVLSEIPILTMQFENKILKILCPMKFEILFHSYFFLTIELRTYKSCTLRDLSFLFMFILVNFLICSFKVGALKV